MASSRKPGPVGLGVVHDAIDDGTLCRQPSPAPGVVGFPRDGKPKHQAPRHQELHVHVRAHKVRAAHIPRLQIGHRGRDVERLQRLLNSRLYGGPGLKVDGWFGEKTRAAVLEFQKKTRLVPDAIVGRKTWFQLLSAPVEKTAVPSQQKGPSATPQVTTTSTTATSGPASGKPTAVAEKGVDEWSLAERFEYVLQRAGSYMAPDLRDQFEALLTPTNLGIMIGTLVVWAGGHFFGISEVTDAFLFGFGLVFLGWAAVNAARYLKNFLELTCTASTKDQLEEAASDLAQAIAIIGVVAFFALLAKVARSLGKASKAADEGAAAPKEEAQPVPKTAPKAIETAVPEDQTVPDKPMSAIEERQAANKALRDSPQFQRDLEKAGVSQQQLEWMNSKEAPLGFKDPQQFQQFKEELEEALRADGLDDAQVGMKGTATTFYSENPGKPLGHFWDADPSAPGDYDLNLASDKMAQHLDETGIDVSPKYGVYRTADVNSEFPALSDFSAKWSGILGRDVNIVGYPADTVPVRDATEFVLVK